MYASSSSQPPTFTFENIEHECERAAMEGDSETTGEEQSDLFSNTRIESIILDTDSKLGGDQAHGHSIRDEVRRLRQSIEDLPRYIVADICEVFADFEMRSAVQTDSKVKKISAGGDRPPCHTPPVPMKRPAPFVQFQNETGGNLLIPFERRTLRTHTANTLQEEEQRQSPARESPSPSSPSTAKKVVAITPTPVEQKASCISATSSDVINGTPVPIRQLSPQSPVTSVPTAITAITPRPDINSTKTELSGSSRDVSPILTPTVPCDVTPLDGPTMLDGPTKADGETVVLFSSEQKLHLRKGNSIIAKAIRWKNSRDLSRCTVHAMVHSSGFDYASAILVIVNACTIGMQTDYMARNMTDVPSVPYRVVDVFFCIAFTAEIVMRVVALGRRFFRAPDGKWNVFDLILVSLQVSDEILSNYTNWSNKSRINFSVLRIVRILRLIRIMRLVRILRLVGELRTIIASILGSLRPLFYTIFLLFMFIYVFAVYLTQLVLDFRVGSPEEAAKDKHLEYYYGSLLRSIFSLYQAISGGIDWDALADPLMERISVFLGFVLAAYTAFCLLALMNVVTGVFVEAAMESAKKDRASYILGHVKELFKKADPENTGTLNWDRFQSSLHEDFMQEIFKTIDVCLSEARSVFALLDADDSGEIELDEFLNGCLGLHGPAKAVHLATLMYETRIATRFHAQHISHIEQLIIQILDTMHIAHSVKPATERELVKRKSFANLAAAITPPPERKLSARIEGNLKNDKGGSVRRFSFDLDPHVEAMKGLLMPGVINPEYES